MKKPRIITLLFSLVICILTFSVFAASTAKQKLIANLTTSEFLQALSAPQVPGGASACSYVNAMSAAICVKTAKLSLKKATADDKKALDAIIIQGNLLQQKSLDLTQKDVDNFKIIAHLWGKNKSTADAGLGAEKNKDFSKEEILAAQIPLEIMEQSYAILQLCAFAKKHINAIYRSDLGVSINLSLSALQGAKLMVLSDIPYIKSKQEQNKILSKMEGVKS